MEEASGPPVDIWPENEQAFRLFTSVLTQWRVGHGGAYGLDYNVLYHRLDRMNLTPARYDALEAEIQVMEEAAIAQMQANQKKKA